MNIEVLKYSIKVWLASFVLCIPIAIIGIRLYGVYFKEYNLFMFDYDKLFFFALGRILVLGIPFLFFFSLINEVLNRKFENEQFIKKLLSVSCALLIVLFGLLSGTEYFYLWLSISNVLPIVFLMLLLLFIWIFKLKTKPMEIEMEDILDAYEK